MLQLRRLVALLALITLSAIPRASYSATCDDTNDPKLSASDTDPPLDAISRSVGTWAIPGSLRAGTVYVDCGGSVAVGIDARIGWIDLSSGTPSIVAGSLEVLRRPFPSLTPNSSPSTFGVAGILAIGPGSTVTIDQGGYVGSGAGEVSVTDPSIDASGRNTSIEITGSSGNNISTWEVGTVLTIGSPSISQGASTNLEVTSGGLLRVGERLDASKANVLVSSGGRLELLSNPRRPSLVLRDGANVVVQLQGTLTTPGVALLEPRATIDVHDAGSLLYIGSGVGIGTDSSIQVRAGARAESGADGTSAGPPSSDHLVIGSGLSAGGTARLTVRDAGSRWVNTTDTFVGNTVGRGVLELLFGGVLENRNGNIGIIDNGIAYATDSDVLVRGQGSQWVNSGSLRVGTLGELRVDQAGSVTSAGGVVEQGTVVIDGAGSQWWNTGDLTQNPQALGTGVQVVGGGLLRDVNARVLGGSIVIDGAGSLWDNLSDVSASGANVTIRGGGAAVNNESRIGEGATSFVTVDGAGSTWNNRLDLILGPVGRGELSVSGGARVDSRYGFVGHGNTQNPAVIGGVGVATITDPGSEWRNASDLWVGYETGKGLLRIQNGGSVYSQGGFVLNNPINTPDRANYGVYVDGQGSSWRVTQRLSVGSGVANTTGIVGDLRVQNGGVVTSETGEVGVRNAGSPGARGTVRVSGAGAMWVNARDLQVAGGAQGGNGELFVEAGGVVTSVAGGPLAPARIGTGVVGGGTGAATVNVDGPGSAWIYHGDVELGLSNAQAALNVTNGGTVTTAGSAIAGAQAGGSFTRATVAIDGASSLWEIGGDLALGSSDANATLALTNGGRLTVGGTLSVGTLGVITVDSGASLSANSIVLPNAGHLTWLSGALAATSVNVPLVNNFGTLMPGQSPGMLALPAYTQGSGGRLLIEIGGRQLGVDHDHLRVAGSLSLGGALELVLVNGFAPRGGDSFDIIDWGTRSGTFASLVLPQLGPGQSWDTSMLYTAGVVSVTPEPSVLTLLGAAALTIVVRASAWLPSRCRRRR